MSDLEKMEEIATSWGGVLSDWGDFLFVWCVEAMKYFSAVSGMSYEVINILLFVILGPLSTVSFFVSTILAYKGKKRAAWITGIIGVILVLAVLVPSVYGLFATPWLYI